MDILNKIKNILKNNILVRNIVLATSLAIISLTLVNVALKLFTRHGEKYSVPNFSGMTMQQAEQAAQDLKLQLEVIDSLYVPTQLKGVVLEQYPKPGNFVKSKRRIFLTTNTFNPKMVPVPYVTGFSLRQAKNKIIGSGFSIGKITYREDLATNNVIDEKYNGISLKSGSEVMGDIGSNIDLIVGLNPVDPEPVVPSIIGLNVSEAKNKLWESGFNMGDIDMDNDITIANINQARVYYQSPNKMRHTMHGKSVSFGLTMDKEKLAKESKKAEDESRKYLEEIKNTDSDSTLIDKSSVGDTENEIDNFFEGL